MRITAKAKVQITVEVEASAWGGDCPISQLYKQAGDSGIEQLRSLLRGSSVKIIGEPKIIGILTADG